MQIKRNIKLHWTGFEPRASDLLEQLNASPLRINLPTWTHLFSNLKYFRVKLCGKINDLAFSGVVFKWLDEGISQ